MLIVARVSCVIGMIGSALVIYNGIFYFLQSRGADEVVKQYGDHFSGYNEKSNEFGNWLLQSNSFNQSHAATVIMVEKYVYTRDIIAGAIQMGMFAYFLLLMRGNEYQAIDSELQRLRDFRILKVKLAIWIGLELLAIVSYVIAVGVDYGFLLWTSHEEAHTAAEERLRNRALMSLCPTYMFVLGLLYLRKVVNDGSLLLEAQKI